MLAVNEIRERGRERGVDLEGAVERVHRLLFLTQHPTSQAEVVPHVGVLLPQRYGALEMHPRLCRLTVIQTGTAQADQNIGVAGSQGAALAKHLAGLTRCSSIFERATEQAQQRNVARI